MTTWAQALEAATAELAAVTEMPRLDAEILLGHALGAPRAQVLARLKDPAHPTSFESLIARRLACEPLAYILGEWEFFSLQFEVVPPVLVPRPETEHLVEVVVEALADGAGERPARVLEIGTGTGCVAVAVAHVLSGARVVATDIRGANLALAGRNAVRHGVADRIAFRHGDLFEALGPEDGPFDVICSNPPYVAEGDWDSLDPVIRRYEDRGALLAGPGGLDIIRRLAAEAPGHLSPGGLLVFEMGMGQDEAVKTLLQEYRYQAIGIREDLAGIPRIAFGRVGR